MEQKSSVSLYIGSWQLPVDDFLWPSDDTQQCTRQLIVVRLGDELVGPFDVSYDVIVDKEIAIKSILGGNVKIMPSIVTSSGQQGVVSATETVSTDDTDHFASAIEFYNQFDLFNAARSFHLLLQTDPNHAQGLFNMASILHMSGYPTLSVHYIQRLLELAPDDVTAHSFLWALTTNPDCSKAVAVDAYRQLAARGDLRAITKLATLTGEGAAAGRGDPSYARAIYEDMAERFEGKLVDHLGYRGPWLLLEMLDELYNSACSSDSITADSTATERSGIVMPAQRGQWRILDVGCGSGLCGRIFAPYVAARTTKEEEESGALSSDQTHLTLSQAVGDTSGGSLMAGVDVSERMVEITRGKGGYDCLAACDLSQALQQINSTFSTLTDSGAGCARLDMIIAADTFIYVGALGDVFSAARAALSANGLLVFSTEDLDASPMRVQTLVIGGGSSGDDDNGGCGSDGQNAAASSSRDSSRSGNNPDSSSGGGGGESGSSEIAGAVPGWGCQLLTSARFAHSHRYVLALCERHGFAVAAHKETTLRTEETIPLQGNLYILQKRDTDSCL